MTSYALPPAMQEAGGPRDRRVTKNEPFANRALTGPRAAEVHPWRPARQSRISVVRNFHIPQGTSGALAGLSCECSSGAQGTA